MGTIATLDPELGTDPPNTPRWRPVVLAAAVDAPPETDDARWLTELLVGAA